MHKFVLGYTTPGVIMLVVSIAGGFLTCGIARFATLSEGGFDPLAVLTSLLPLQLTALIWALTSAPKAAARRLPAPRPPASD